MTPPSYPRTRDAAADLLLGGRCAGCHAPGGVLCSDCRGRLPRVGAVFAPDPVPLGLAPSFAVGPYDALLRDLVVGHKERGLTGLRTVLGDLLALAVTAALARGPGPTSAAPSGAGDPAPGAGPGPAGGLLLVPVPSRRTSVRARGRDPLLDLTRCAATRLVGDLPGGAGGPWGPVVVGPVLRSRPGVVDQSGLGAVGRGANLAGSMAVRTGVLRRLAGRVGAVHVVVCDDVLTTGSTAREAQRALEAVGVPVLAIATVAATRRRSPSGAPAEFMAKLQQ